MVSLCEFFINLANVWLQSYQNGLFCFKNAEIGLFSLIPGYFPALKSDRSVFQAVLSTSVLLAMYYSNQVWAFGALFSLLLLQAMSGMCLGLLITSLCSSRDQVIQLGIAAVLPTFVLSGIIWPREAMPSLLKAFSEILPTTVSCDVAKSLMLKGDAAPDLAALGFGIPCLWIMAMVVLCKFHTVSWAMK